MRSTLLPENIVVERLLGSGLRFAGSLSATAFSSIFHLLYHQSVSRWVPEASRPARGRVVFAASVLVSSTVVFLPNPHA
jgi:hypothetical protein